jgi:drug/metabolite transporter (DMT)-like permease
LVPVLAAFGGVLFVAEVLSLRLVVSTVLVLSGIYLVIVATKLYNKL